jgi:hypothetical protein
MRDLSIPRRDFLDSIVFGGLASGVLSEISWKSPDDLRSISYSETLAGVIDEQDPTSGFEDRDYYTEPIKFEGSAGDSIFVELSSDEFEPHIRLLNPNGRPIGTDNLEGATGIKAYLQKDGTHTINVSTSKPKRTGRYSISIAKITSDLRQISYGQHKGGIISESDPTSGFYREQTRYIEPVTFEGTSGDSVTITMFIENFNFEIYDNPRLRLIDPDGNTIASDSGAIRAISGRAMVGISADLYIDGEYTINVGSTDSAPGGEYLLHLEGESSNPPSSTDTETTSKPTETTTTTTQTESTTTISTEQPSTIQSERSATSPTENPTTVGNSTRTSEFQRGFFNNNQGGNLKFLNNPFFLTVAGFLISVSGIVYQLLEDD